MSSASQFRFLREPGFPIAAARSAPQYKCTRDVYEFAEEELIVVIGRGDFSPPVGEMTLKSE
jgi:hypothetical protein